MRSRSLRAVALAAAALAVVVVVSCSDSSSSPPGGHHGACAELASRCHPVKTPLGIECHELGHDGDDSRCGPRRAECLAECPETEHGDASHAGDASTTPGDADASHEDAGPDPCVAYCACMLSTCATDAGTTFGDEAACLSACRGFPASDVACYAGHCEAAKTASDPEHDCEHARGDVACH